MPDNIKEASEIFMEDLFEALSQDPAYYLECVGGKGHCGTGGGGGKTGKGGGGTGGSDFTIKFSKGLEVLSTTKIIQKIEAGSKAKLDLQKVREKLSVGNKYGLFSKSSVDPNKLHAEGMKDVLKAISKSPEKFTFSSPIVINSKGYIVDGRHRVAKAILSGKKSIDAYVPVVK